MADSKVESVRPKYRWYRFRLRTLLLLVLIVSGILCAWRTFWYSHQSRKQATAVIENAGGYCGFAPIVGTQRDRLYSDEQEKDRAVIDVNLSGGNFDDQCMEALTHFTSLRALVVGGKGFTDQHLGRLTVLPSLKYLMLDSTGTTPVGVASLRKAMPKLGVFQSKWRAINELTLSGEVVQHDEGQAETVSDPIHDAELSLWPKDLRAAAPHGECAHHYMHTYRVEPQVSRVVVTKEEHLAYVPDLLPQELEVRGEWFTDSDIATIKGLANLEVLVLNNSALTAAGLRELKALPQLKFPAIIDNAAAPLLDASEERHRVSLQQMLAAHGDDCIVTGAISADDELAAVTLAELPHVTRLAIRHWFGNNDSLKYFAGLTGLRELSFINTEATVIGLQRFAGMTKLRTLVLEGTSFDNRAVECINSFTGLERLALVNTEVTDTGLVGLAGMTGLKYLDLSCGTGYVNNQRANITTAGMVHLKGLTNLESLCLNARLVADAGLQHLGGLTKLRRLDLQETLITDAGLHYLKSLSQLEDLNLAYTKINASNLGELKAFQRLHSLSLAGLKVPKDNSTGVGPLPSIGLEHLKRLPQLRSLDLGFSTTRDADIEHLVGLPLEHLRLNGTVITDKGLVHVGKMRQLASLELLGTRQFTVEGLAHLAALVRLRRLVLAGRDITDAVLGQLQGLKELRELVLYHTPITDVGLENLKELQELRRLDLRSTKITDRGVVHLQGLRHLEELELGHTAVGDRGVEYLTDLPGVKILGVSHHVTPSKVEALQRTWPKAKITRDRW